MALQLLYLLFIFVTVSEGAEYSDLQSLGAACFPKDSCNRRPRGLVFPNVSCECDNLCLSYDDCCLDAHVVVTEASIQKNVGLTCLQYGEHKGVFAVAKCSQSWTGPPALRKKCENQDDFSDPLLSVPTTDTKAHITYRNRYCAVCNNANPDNLSTWSPTLTCHSLTPVNSEHKNITRDFIVQNIARVGSYWGVYHWNQSLRGMSFYPCEVSFSLPPALKKSVRGCAPDAVSTCPTSWKRDHVRRSCHSYMAVIFVNGQAYRNVHCAVCNLGSFDSVQCNPPILDSRDRPPLSFTLLVDVNPSDGNMVGVTNSCPAGHMFDPFFKKCRALVCAVPGTVLRNGRCVRG